MVAPEVAKYKPTERLRGAPGGRGANGSTRDFQERDINFEGAWTSQPMSTLLTSTRAESVRMAWQIPCAGIEIYENDGGAVLGGSLGCCELCGRDQQSCPTRTIGSFSARRNRR